MLYNEMEKVPFSHNYMFFNMAISLNITLMCLKMSVHSAETRLEGTMSQNCNIVLSFCFMVRRKGIFWETNTKIT